jgi:ribosomal protein L4
METACYRIKLKAGMINDAKNWAEHLNSRTKEVLGLLKSEGVTVESAFLDQVNGEDYLIYYLRAENLENAHKIASESNHPVDIFHRNSMKQISDGSTTLVKLVDFSTID